MPQLDIVIFFNQFFWFFGLFLITYVFFTYIIVPKINFYYFIRFNIRTSFERFGNSYNFQNLMNEASSQNMRELEHIYIKKFYWFNTNICSPTFSSNNFYIPFIKIGVNITTFYLSEIVESF